MRTDLPLFKDPRVRRAVALTINRPQQLGRVMLGAGLIGDDNPFWKKFASTDPSARALYESFGFEREGYRKQHFRRGREYVDAILMAYEIGSAVGPAPG